MDMYLKFVFAILVLIDTYFFLLTLGFLKDSWPGSEISRLLVIVWWVLSDSSLRILVVHFSWLSFVFSLTPSQQVWKSLKFPWKFVWALNRGPRKLAWWQMLSSWNAKSLKHITRRTLSECMEENDSPLSASGCYRDLGSNRKILEVHVSNCEANSIPHVTQTVTSHDLSN